MIGSYANATSVSWTQGLQTITADNEDGSTIARDYYSTIKGGSDNWYCPKYRPSPVTLMVDTDGITRSVPGLDLTELVFDHENYLATSLYNDCGSDRQSTTNLNSIEAYKNSSSYFNNLDITAAGCTLDDDNSENCSVYHGYVFADNYFELYVNGVYIANDDGTFYPFDSSVVRFSVPNVGENGEPRIAIKAIDLQGFGVDTDGKVVNEWGGTIATAYTGLGVEANAQGSNVQLHVGDGGLIARFVLEPTIGDDNDSQENETDIVTNSDWYAQVYAISPIGDKENLDPDTRVVSGDGEAANLDCVKASGNISTVVDNLASCYAAHFTIPSNWFAKSFSPQDNGWPNATEYTASELGEDKNAFCNFTNTTTRSDTTCSSNSNQYDLWGAAQFIWGKNASRDNVMLFIYDPS
ncbi:MAG: hypothetical protein AAGA27_00695 [Pseudomonadota bacterium]